MNEMTTITQEQRLKTTSKKTLGDHCKDERIYEIFPQLVKFFLSNEDQQITEKKFAGQDLVYGFLLDFTCLGKSMHISREQWREVKGYIENLAVDWNVNDDGFREYLFYIKQLETTSQKRLGDHITASGWTRYELQELLLYCAHFFEELDKLEFEDKDLFMDFLTDYWTWGYDMTISRRQWQRIARIKKRMHFGYKLNKWTPLYHIQGLTI